ncbi:hypothetical protein NP493_308g02035 [Ridgeia piscesae]|uniref:Uncharacterized protein n=1 Tax=Ridgeia piscesae TaxID=27915 RepID=A0AAD9L765_RIDPI|nr:hypothetical protein NP493_308g02035 [Ridgeia piscesae]
MYLEAEPFPLFEVVYLDRRVSRQTCVDDPQPVSAPAAVRLSRGVAVKQDGRVVGEHALRTVEEDDGRDGAQRPTRCLDLKRVRGPPVDVSIRLDGAGQHLRFCDVTAKCHAQSFVCV